jgi:hypothetical protein
VGRILRALVTFFFLAFGLPAARFAVGVFFLPATFDFAADFFFRALVFDFGFDGLAFGLLGAPPVLRAFLTGADFFFFFEVFAFGLMGLSNLERAAAELKSASI